ncbi:hypothetical protein CNJ01550 [Cryptococcus deneoformans JEC21]|uniref:Uncharacterized protein n=1 Tax=Cryptococcus deneoformans (strain JEC21 / ATCC MYA-565) TaxID=214684 RepID=Q5KAI6_CRYD1|nr:hypothetical protein CNJ01550 [Cryptococcus neoformans var. neoformans JEC21]AAW45913.2 hypothetical protein CNJ01550 [Cryptococcus neoformans var. neoformans JEC21]
MATLMDFSHPDRRSDAEFQEILDTFVGDNETVLTGNLPNLLAGYEKDHEIKILEEADFLGVKELCEQYPDLELGPVDLFGFLMAVLQRETSPAYPTPNSAPSPGHITPEDGRRRRRISDRIRSPSDNSSSSSSGEENDIRSNRQGSAPSSSQASFQSSTTAPGPAGFAVPVRKKTLSDPNRSDSSLDSPLPVRMRSKDNPPSAFTGGFARPSPASRRRTASSTIHPDDDLKSTDLSNPIKRSFSSSSLRLQSPQPWKRLPSHHSSRPPSPMSPMDQIDSTSLHERTKSREIDDGKSEEVEQIEQKVIPDVELDQMEDEEGNEKRDGVDHDVGGNETLLPRLSRISTESMASLHTSHDQLRRLRKENNELSRKLKETEKSLALQGAENERLVEDLQTRLEETQSEIAQRRKDEKEMRGKDRAQLIQISGYEADVLSLQRSLENARANHANMQKMYNSQCDEAQRLRDMLRDRDEEIRELEDAVNAHSADEEKLTQEIRALEDEVKRLEADLSRARQAESHLQVQKQENLALKETIDRMRFDLDEARAAAALAGGGTGRGTGSAAASSVGGTISRNLGDELGRRLVAVERVEEEEVEDGFVETIVTTQRTRKVGGRSAQSAGSPSQDPAVRIEKGIREYIDASAATDSALHETISSEPPAYTVEPPPINSDQILQRAHPRDHKHLEGLSESGETIAEEEEYEALVDALGVRCTILEDEVKMKKLERAKNGGGPVRRRHKRHSWTTDQATGGIVQFFFHGTNDSRDTLGRFAVFAVAVFAFGVIAGPHLLGPSAAGLHPRDYKLFQQMNTLASVAGVGEGFLPAHMLGVVENGARLVAGRIPT